MDSYTRVTKLTVRLSYDVIVCGGGVAGVAAAVTDAKYGQGLVHTAKMWPGGRGIGIREEFFDVSKGGAAKAHVRWTISSLDGAPMKLERAYLRFPLPVDDFA